MNEAKEKQEYQYFTNGTWPIRLTVIEDGTPIAAETPNLETGKLEKNSHWYMEILKGTNSDIDEITKDEFDQMCGEFLAEKKSNPALNSPGGMD